MSRAPRCRVSSGCAAERGPSHLPLRTAGPGGGPWESSGGLPAGLGFTPSSHRSPPPQGRGRKSRPRLKVSGGGNWLELDPTPASLPRTVKHAVSALESQSVGFSFALPECMCTRTFRGAGDGQSAAQSASGCFPVFSVPGAGSAPPPAPCPLLTPAFPSAPAGPGQRGPAL